MKMLNNEITPVLMSIVRSLDILAEMEASLVEAVRVIAQTNSQALQIQLGNLNKIDFNTLPAEIKDTLLKQFGKDAPDVVVENNKQN